LILVRIKRPVPRVFSKTSNMLVHRVGERLR
jgi:hypothetical protein